MNRSGPAFPAAIASLRPTARPWLERQAGGPGRCVTRATGEPDRTGACGARRSRAIVVAHSWSGALATALRARPRRLRLRPRAAGPCHSPLAGRRHLVLRPASSAVVGTAFTSFFAAPIGSAVLKPAIAGVFHPNCRRRTMRNEAARGSCCGPRNSAPTRRTCRICSASCKPSSRAMARYQCRPRSSTARRTRRCRRLSTRKPSPGRSKGQADPAARRRPHAALHAPRTRGERSRPRGGAFRAGGQIRPARAGSLNTARAAAPPGRRRRCAPCWSRPACRTGRPRR